MGFSGSNGIPSPEKKNHGPSQSKMMRGQSIEEAYGKDSSAVTGSVSDERGPDLGGGPTNLSHSLSGGSAKQNI